MRKPKNNSRNKKVKINLSLKFIFNRIIDIIPIVLVVLSWVVNDFITTKFLISKHSAFEIILARHIFMTFFCLFFWGNNLKLQNIQNPILILIRSIITAFAFYLTIINFNTLHLNQITLLYYTIPIFSCAIEYTLEKKIDIQSVIFIVFFCMIMFTNFTISSFLTKSCLIFLSGCFLFSVCDFFIQKSPNSHIEEVGFSSILISIIFLPYFSLDIFNVYTFLLGFSSFIMTYLLFEIFQKNDFSTLISFRYLDIVFAGFFSQTINFKLTILVIFTIMFNIFLNKNFNNRKVS